MQNIQRQLRADDICVLTFDRPDSAANLLDSTTLEELGAHLAAIGAPGLGVKGLVLLSGKPGMFIAGADLRAVLGISREELREMIALGQRVFSQLAALALPTVAAMDGAALGGGYELALACDWRVASPESATTIGLPETRLGLLPAWGGSTRLPRLIGLPAALDLILSGKALPAKSALQRGMIDALAARENLLPAALELLRRGKRPASGAWSPLKVRVLAPVTRARAHAQVMARTRGLLPAPLKALDVVIGAAIARDEATGLRLERDALLELASAPEAGNLIRLFFLQQRAKKLGAGGDFISEDSMSKESPIRTAAIIGAGAMGAGIAHWLSARAVRVILRDTEPARVASGLAKVAQLTADEVARGVRTERDARRGMDRISPAATEVPLRRADIVIEAATETLEVKKAIFRRLHELTREDAILAANTSALSVTEFASETRNPSRVIGLHFFNPVDRMQLVEVVVGRDTAPAATQRAIRFVQQMGKLPVVVKDSPGFLVNRILLPAVLEAGHLFWQGAAVQEIDAAMLDFGMPMGPLRWIDEVGVDVAHDVARTLAAAFPDRLRIPEILPAMIGAGLLGKKTGKGFYRHASGKDGEPNRGAVALRPRGASTLSRDELQRRMVLLMVNEAARCVEEGIAESAADIDFATVMGAGFAPFRGGPLRHADAVGAAKIVAELSHLVESAGPHFAPCALLTEMAKTDRRFHGD